MKVGLLPLQPQYEGQGKLSDRADLRNKIRLNSLGLNEAWAHQPPAPTGAHQELPEHWRTPTKKMTGSQVWQPLLKLSNAAFLRASGEPSHTQSPLGWHLQFQGRHVLQKQRLPSIQIHSHMIDSKNRKVSILTLIIWNGDFKRL